jgi:hypothetical protein
MFKALIQKKADVLENEMISYNSEDRVFCFDNNEPGVVQYLSEKWSMPGFDVYNVILDSGEHVLVDVASIKHRK